MRGLIAGGDDGNRASKRRVVRKRQILESPGPPPKEKQIQPSGKRERGEDGGGKAHGRARFYRAERQQDAACLTRRRRYAVLTAGMNPRPNSAPAFTICSMARCR